MEKQYVCCGDDSKCVAILVGETDSHMTFRLENGDVVVVERQFVFGDLLFEAKNVEFECSQQ